MRRYLFFAIMALMIQSTAAAQQIPLVSLEDAKPKTVETGKQIQIAADLRNNQDIQQKFAYVVQIQNSEDVTVYLAWLTGSLEPAQAFSPAISWIPSEAGNYEATIFVWESIDNPSALSPTLSLSIEVVKPSV